MQSPVLLVPVLLPLAAAFLCFFLGLKNEKARDYSADLVTAVTFLVSLLLTAACVSGAGEQNLFVPGIAGAGMYLALGGFNGLFACVTSYMWTATTIFSRDYLAHAEHRNRYYLFLLITFSATMGVFLGGDLFTVFLFFEVMSMASYVCVIHDEKDLTLRAGGVYLAVAVIGGLVSLMGIFLLQDMAGTLRVAELHDACLPLLSGPLRGRLFLAGFLILFGFGAKAGMFPLHIWLPMAHPVAPAPASALLSGIITKSGILGILVLTANVFPHDGVWGFIICMFGVVTMLLGGLLAMFSVDIKRTLACSSMSQLGMIICGIGMQGLLGEENALAVRGSILHMFNHSNLKLVLFMAAGVIVMNLHKLNLNEIRGYGRKKPLLKLVFLSGALGIAGVPLFNGYVSKTLLHESIVEYIELLEEGHAALPAVLAAALPASPVLFFRIVEWLFLITGGMTVAYMTKLFLCVFVEKNTDAALQAVYDSGSGHGGHGTAGDAGHGSHQAAAVHSAAAHAGGAYMRPASAAVLAFTAAVLPVLGCFPYFTLNRLADMSQGFLHGEMPAHAVHYFNFTNLKGGFTSLLIGALLYFGFIRTFLMANDSKGRRVYVNRWPKGLDLLTLIYEPLVLRLFPAVFGFLASIPALLPDLIISFRPLTGFFKVLARALDFIPDGLVLLARKSSHRQLPEAQIPPTGYYFSYYMGALLNRLSRFFRRLFGRRGKKVNYILVLAEKEAVFKATRRLIVSSSAFSLIMFGIGTVVIVLYLLVL